MTGNGKDIVNHRAFNTIGSQFGLIRNLGVVLIEVLRELHLRLFDELQVTHATDDDTQGNRIVGFGFGLVELCGDAEFSHTTREIGRTLGQRINLNIDTGGDNLFLNLHITGASVEESLEGIDVTVLLHHDAVEGDAGYLKLTRQLWEHHILAPCHSAIRTAIERFHLEALLLRKFHLLCVETLQVGHLTLQLRQRDQGIDLICQKNGLLLIDTFLVGAHFDEEIRSGDMTAGIPQFRLIILLTLLAGRCGITPMSLRRTADLDREGIGSNALAVHNHMGCGNGIATVLGSHHDIRIRDRRR